jgi:hypothetical protein
MPSLKEYEEMVKDKLCRWCGVPLKPKIEYYEHLNGWVVDGFPNRLWLWKECPKCGHQWSLEKLGIERDPAAFTEYKPPIIITEDKKRCDESYIV